MTRDEIIRALDWHAPTVEAGPQSLLRRIESLVAQAEAAEREACAKLIEPSEEHRRDASWGYIGGEEGVEMLDAMAAKIRARGQL